MTKHAFLKNLPQGFYEALRFPLAEALIGRRSRRFFMGAEIPDGPLAHSSELEPMPLSEAETWLLLTAMGGGTGWHNMIYRAERYAPQLSNYACAAGGRPFPSAAGFHTTEIFWTDDAGVWMLPMRDVPPPVEREPDGGSPIEELVAECRSRVLKLQDGRLGLPPETPFVEAHNTWVVNQPGTTLVIPVADAAQHMLANLCYYLQNGSVLYDDRAGSSIPGMDEFSDLADMDNPLPLSFIEMLTVQEITAEISSCCYAGALMLQAMGLGGWMFNGIDPFAVLGAARDPRCPGLGFDFSVNERWPVPNPTGRPGIFEAFCPPRFNNMREAVEALCERKFGPGGPFHPDTPGPWRDTSAVRSAAAPHDERFRRCVAAQAQYILDAYGKFPASIPSVLTATYLQAMHLDLGFYDRRFKPGAYLRTHAEHKERWHEEPGGERF